MSERPRLTSKSVLASALLFFVLATACSKASVETDSAQSFDWDNIVRNGLTVDALAEAQGYLSFEPISPRSLGSPLRILVSDPAQFELDARSVGMEFKDPTYGHFWIIENASQTTQKELEGLVDQCKSSPKCEGTWSVVDIRDGVRAVLIEGPPSTLLEWLESGLRVVVMGSPDEFTGDEAISVANAI
jgi:hypothetical protein